MSGFETTVILLLGQLVALCLDAARRGRPEADIECAQRKGGAR